LGQIPKQKVVKLTLLMLSFVFCLHMIGRCRP